MFLGTPHAGVQPTLNSREEAKREGGQWQVTAGGCWERGGGEDIFILAFTETGPRIEELSTATLHKPPAPGVQHPGAAGIIEYGPFAAPRVTTASGTNPGAAECEQQGGAGASGSFHFTNACQGKMNGVFEL